MDQREGRALQELLVPKVSKVMTRKVTRDPRENQVFLEIEVPLVTPTSLLGCQQFSKSPVTEGRRVKRAMLEVKVNVDHVEWMEKLACLAATDSREKKETWARKVQGEKGEKRDSRAQPERKDRKESQDSLESMVVLVTREKQERKEGLEITDDKDHRALPDRPYQSDRPYPDPEVPKAHLVIRVFLGETEKRVPLEPWAIVV